MEASFRPLSARARWMLRAALIVAWASGVGGTFTSCMLLGQYRGPRPPRTTLSAPASATQSAPEIVSAAPSAEPSEVVSAAPSAEPSEVASAAPSAEPSAAPSAEPSAPAAPSLGPTEAEADVMMDAFDRFRSTRLPLTAANLVLSIALVVGAARTLGRRPGGRSWLRQVCVATALFAVAEYVVSRDERAYLVEHLPPVMAVRLERTGLAPEQAEERLRASVRMRFLLVLLAQLGLYGGLAVALGRPSVAFELAPERAQRGSLPPPSTDDS